MNEKSIKVEAKKPIIIPLHTIRIVIIQKKKINKQQISVGEDVEHLESSCITGGIIKWYKRCGRQYGGSTKN